jgi:hypothetical protein
MVAIDLWKRIVEKDHSWRKSNRNARKLPLTAGGQSECRPAERTIMAKIRLPGFMVNEKLQLVPNGHAKPASSRVYQ